MTVTKRLLEQSRGYDRATVRRVRVFNYANILGSNVDRNLGTSNQGL